LRYLLSEKLVDEKRERIMPRVSKETGGMMPGINSFKDVQEIEDLEYIERLRNGFK